MNTIKLISIKKASLFIVAMLFSMLGFSKQHVTMSLRNISITANTIEYDLYVVNDGDTRIKMSGCSFGVNFDEEIINGGILTYSLKANTRSESFDKERKVAVANSNVAQSMQARMTTTLMPFLNSNDLAPNVPFKIGRFMISNSNRWTANTNPNLSFQELAMQGKTSSLLIGFLNDNALLTTLSAATETVAFQVEVSPVLNAMVPLESANISKLKKGPANGLLNAENNVNIYPNPASAVLNLDYFATKDTWINARVYDLQGRIVLQSQANLVEGYNNIGLDIESLVKGFYVIKIIDRDNFGINQTFTKN